MPILHVVILLAILAALGFFVGVPWVYVMGAFVVCLLIIIAVYRRV